MGYRFYSMEETGKVMKRFMNPDDAGNLNESLIACHCMLADRMLGLSFPPEQCVQFARRVGLTGEQPDPLLLAGAFAGRFSLRLRIGRGFEALSSLGRGGYAVVGCAGPSPAETHLILAERMGDGGFRVLDPACPGGKGLLRARKRLTKTDEEYILIPDSVFSQVYPDVQLVMAFSL